MDCRGGRVQPVFPSLAAKLASDAHGAAQAAHQAHLAQANGATEPPPTPSGLHAPPIASGPVPGGVTILDGELISDMNTGSKIYLVFDTVRVAGVDTGAMTDFVQRIRMAQLMVGPETAAVGGEPPREVRLQVKEFVPIQSVALLASNIVIHPEHGFWCVRPCESCGYVTCMIVWHSI